MYRAAMASCKWTEHIILIEQKPRSVLLGQHLIICTREARLATHQQQNVQLETIAYDFKYKYVY